MHLRYVSSSTISSNLCHELLCIFAPRSCSLLAQGSRPPMQLWVCTSRGRPGAPRA